MEQRMNDEFSRAPGDNLGEPPKPTPGDRPREDFSREDVPEAAAFQEHDPRPDNSSNDKPVTEDVPLTEVPVTYARTGAGWRPKDEDPPVLNTPAAIIPSRPSEISWTPDSLLNDEDDPRASDYSDVASWDSESPLSRPEDSPTAAGLAPDPYAPDAYLTDLYDTAPTEAASTSYEVEEPLQAASGFDAAKQSEIDSRDKELDLLDHLGELRTRILRSVTAVLLATVVTWQYRNRLLEFFAAPVQRELKQHGANLITIDPTEGFTIYLQVTLVAAILLAIPVIIYQAWAFIEPALTGQERRYGAFMIPFSIILFFSGVTLGYYLSPIFFRFFLQFTPPATVANWSYAFTATFLAKMLLVFGVCFQVPVITIFLNKIGLLSRNWMIEYWRHVVVVIFALVAVMTPTWDPVTLFAAAAPPCLLYAFSIWLVKWL
jgi:sec-independent protein translocase protein TatC